MRWIEYDYVCNEKKGIIFHKKVEYNEANLAIAKAEACDGKYTISADDMPAKTVLIESSDYPGCYYRRIYDEEEWLNPPMVQDVEYRTAERFKGAPVYTKLVSAVVPGAGANGKTTIAAATAYLLCECYFAQKNAGGIFPISVSTEGGPVSASISGGVLQANFNNTQNSWSPGVSILYKAKYVKAPLNDLL